MATARYPTDVERAVARVGLLQHRERIAARRTMDRHAAPGLHDTDHLVTWNRIAALRVVVLDARHRSVDHHAFSRRSRLAHEAIVEDLSIQAGDIVTLRGRAQTLEHH